MRSHAPADQGPLAPGDLCIYIGEPGDPSDFPLLGRCVTIAGFCPGKLLCPCGRGDLHYLSCTVVETGTTCYICQETCEWAGIPGIPIHGSRRAFIKIGRETAPEQKETKSGEKISC